MYLFLYKWRVRTAWLWMSCPPLANPKAPLLLLCSSLQVTSMKVWRCLTHLVLPFQSLELGLVGVFWRVNLLKNAKEFFPFLYHACVCACVCMCVRTCMHVQASVFVCVCNCAHAFNRASLVPTTNKRLLWGASCAECGNVGTGSNASHTHTHTHTHTHNTWETTQNWAVLLACPQHRANRLKEWMRHTFSTIFGVAGKIRPIQFQLC